MDKRFSRAALRPLAYVMILAPALRLFPSLAARTAGRAGWLSALAALPILLLYARFLSAFTSSRPNGSGLGELILDALGDKAGKAALMISAAWFVMYAGFVMRAGAERLITTIYPNTEPQFFTLIMGGAVLYAVLGSARSIVRMGRLAFPIVFGALMIILVIGLFHIDPALILPVSRADTLPIIRGMLPAADVSVCMMYIVCFLEGGCDNESGRFRVFALWSVGAALLLSLISAAVLGSFGAELTARLTRPFFSLVRNLVFFSSLERMEALVVSLWVFPDFLTAAVFVFSAQHCLRLALGKAANECPENRSDMRFGRYIIPLCAAAAILASVFLGRDNSSLRLWSETVIPAANLTYAFGALPIIYIISRKRKKEG